MVRSFTLSKWLMFLVMRASAPLVRAIPAISESNGSISLPSRFSVPDISAALQAASWFSSSISRFVITRFRESSLFSCSVKDLYTPYMVS